MLVPHDEGLYCPAGDFHMSTLAAGRPRRHHPRPRRPRACGQQALPHRGERRGPSLRPAWRRGSIETPLEYGARSTLNGVRVSLHPAGHILGSPRCASKQAARSGSSRATTRPDPTRPARRSSRCAATSSSPNRPSACRSTAGRPQAEVFAEINAWWRANQAAGKASLLFGYALGKAQRLLAGLDPSIGPIYTHGAVEGSTRPTAPAGIRPAARRRTSAPLPRDRLDAGDRRCSARPPRHRPGCAGSARPRPPSPRAGCGSAAPAAAGRSTAASSLSDHADWPGLLAAIEATGAERVWVTHGSRPSGPLAATSRASTPAPSRRASRASRTDERRSRRRRMKAFADLYTALDETNADHRQGRGAGARTSPPPSRPTRPGRSTSSPAASPASWSRRAGSRLGRRGGGHPRLAVRGVL